MATLTEVSGVARKAIKFGTIGIVVVMLIPVVWRFAVKVYLTLNPPPPPPPTVKYGKLPVLDFPLQPDVATPSYTLETISGGLPKLDEQVKVYVVDINKSRLLTLDRIKDNLKDLSFLSDPVQLDEQRYRFSRSDLPIEIVMNVITGEYTYQYDWTHDEEVKMAKGAPLSSDAASTAKMLMDKISSLPNDLSHGNVKSQYLIATGSSTLIPTNNVYEANFTRVDLFRSDKDKMKFVTAGGKTSPVFALLSSFRDPKRVVLAGYQYSQIIDSAYSTYPTKGTTKAWEELKAGKAYIAVRPPIDNVVVREIYLAYYESEQAQKFLQAVYVFTGDNDFMAYVPAITDEYIVGKSNQ